MWLNQCLDCRNAAINTAEYYRFIDTQRSEDTQQPEEPSLRTRSRSERKRQTVITKDGKFELRKIWPDAKVIPQSGLQAPPSTVTIKSFFKKLVDVVMHFLKVCFSLCATRLTLIILPFTFLYLCPTLSS